MPLLFRDYETRSTLDLRAVGAWRYSCHPSTDVWCCGYAVDDGPVVKLWIPGDPIPPEFTEAAHNPDWLVSAFNDGFERLMEQHIMAPRYGWPLVPIERHRCLQAAALALALPANLEAVARALSLTQQKTSGATMKQMARPRKPRKDEDPNGVFWFDDIERRRKLHSYCAQDVETQRELHHRIVPLIPPELVLWQLDTVINDRGLHFDRKLVDSAIHIAKETQREIGAELLKITEGTVSTVNHTAKLIAWLAAHGCEVADVQKSTLKRALTRKSIAPEARRVIGLRLDGAHAAANKLETMRAWTNGDGRVRGALKYHGAHTGRWTSHGIQLQNLKRPIVDDIEDAIAVIAAGDIAAVRQCYPQPMSVIGDITRGLICAAPGHKLIAADFSGIESRVTAWLSEQQSKLDQWTRFDSTQNPDDDPYFILGKSCGLPQETARNTGKTADLAFGYMGSTGAWKRLAPDDASDEQTILRYRDAWRRAHPETCRFWRALDNTAIRAVHKPGTAVPCKRVSFVCEGDFLFMALPSGRRLAYPFPRLITNNRNRAVVVFKTVDNGQWTDCRHGHGAYGGTWIENAVQAVARDLFAAAMPRLEATAHPIVLHIHDEIVCEIPDGFSSEEDFRKLMLTLPDWAAGLPVAAKVRIGQRFAKSGKGENGQGPGTLPPCPETPPGDAPPPWEGDSAEEEEAAVEDIHDDAETFSSAESSGNTGKDHAGNDYASGEREWGNNVASYIYRDEHGLPYLKVVRTSAKQFPQYHWNDGRWIKGKPKGAKIPYRLPELIAAKPDMPVFICEGEKDTDNVAALGLVATTNSEGAGKWTSDLNDWFKGKQVAYLLEDNDNSGRRHVARVAAALNGIVPDIYVISFPELVFPDNDVSDWLAQGHTKAELLARATAAPKWQSSQLRGARASNIPIAAIEWLWPNRFALGKLGIICRAA